MPILPDKPFLTLSFGPRSGGIDFLGMRQVNLSVFLEQLIPGLNNVTGDFGVFCLGAWIPWKFEKLAGPKTYTLAGFHKFQEAVEVAVAYVTRSGSPAEERFGVPWRRTGVRNLPQLPGKLTFEGVGRNHTSSLYAAALYGPSLRYIGLLAPSSALAGDGGASGIPVAAKDADTEEIVNGVEAALARSKHFDKVNRLDVPAIDAEALEDLGRHGLHPSFFRTAGVKLKRALLSKLFSADPAGETRRLTAALILATIDRTTVKNVEGLRRCWYTCFLPTGKPLALVGAPLQEHRQKWAVFQARQIQRTAIELLLRCFELAVRDGCRTIDAVIARWRNRSPEELSKILSGTVRQLVRGEAAAVSRSPDLLTASRVWNDKVHGAHASYDDPDETDVDAELLRSLRIVARWWLRTSAWIADGVLPRWFQEGQGERRMSLGWFHRWVATRLDDSVEAMLHDAFSGLVFAQHVKVALMRFDGEVQRLRFTLGDDGIIPCPEVGEKFGSAPKRMDDRLGSFVRLLEDLGVLSWQDGGRLVAGQLSGAATRS